MKLDVVMPTINSASRIGEATFRKILEQVHEQIPTNRFIVVDEGSKDQTVDVAKEYGAVVLEGAGSLGKAREIGIKNVETDWFYFIDDDNLVSSRFHERMMAHANEKTGMIFARAIISHDDYIVRYEAVMAKLRRSLGLQDQMKGRGYTGATLLRTEAVDGIRIPPIERQEDYFIMKYCERHGWKVEYASEIVVLHLSPGSLSYRTQYLEGYGMATVKAISKRRMLASWLLTYPKSIFTFPYVRDGKVLSRIPKAYYAKYKGFTEATRHKRPESEQDSLNYSSTI